MTGEILFEINKNKFFFFIKIDSKTSSELNKTGGEIIVCIAICF